MGPEKKLRFRHDKEPGAKDEEEAAKKVVLDYATVKNAVQTIREFEKEYGISMLERKGLEQAQAILKKHEQQDKLQRFVEEKIDLAIKPLSNKMTHLTEMMSAMMEQQRMQDVTSQEDEREQLTKSTPEYVKKSLRDQ